MSERHQTLLCHPGARLLGMSNPTSSTSTYFLQSIPTHYINRIGLTTYMRFLPALTTDRRQPTTDSLTINNTYLLALFFSYLVIRRPLSDRAPFLFDLVVKPRQLEHLI